jgi:hypothetical protein
MIHTVGVAHGGKKLKAFHDLLQQTDFKSHLEKQHNQSNKSRNEFLILEEVYVNWMFINMKPAACFIDYSLFPPKNIFARAGVWISKQLYNFFKVRKWYRKLYERNRSGAIG